MEAKMRGEGRGTRETVHKSKIQSMGRWNVTRQENNAVARQGTYYESGTLTYVTTHVNRTFNGGLRKWGRGG